VRTVVGLALAYGLAMRAFELTWSARNRAIVLGRGGRAIERDGMAVIAVVHTLWFVGMLAEELFLGPSFDAAAVQAICWALFVLAEALRVWCIATLGPRWNVRVVVLPGAPLVRTGPYRFLAHPNYVGVVVMLAALPLALGLPWTAAVSAPLNLLALRVRIRAEEAALEGFSSGVGREP